MREKNTLPIELGKQIESVQKALSILECFTEETPELTLKELSEKTGLHKSRILRLCGTLLANGFLTRSIQRQYCLGAKLLLLGKVYEKSNSLITLTRPILQDLASFTGETAKMFVIEGTKRVCLCMEEGSYPVRYKVKEGAVFDLHVGSSGKVLLAYTSKEFREEVFNRPLKKYTETTVVDQNLLEKEIMEIRERGWGSASGESVAEVTCISAPVFDYTQDIVGVITVTGLTPRVVGENFHCLRKAVIEATRKLSQLLGFEGNEEPSLFNKAQ